MSEYEKLMEQAKQLVAQAEELREQEKKQAVEQVHQLMLAHGLTLEDLGGGKKGKAAGPRKRRSPAEKPFHYKGPNGEIWKAGRGRKPVWVQELQNAGELEKYRVDAIVVPRLAG